MSRNRSLAVVLAFVVLGCESPTEPQPLAVTLNPVVLATAEEIEAWPPKPVIDAGSQLEIRGFGLKGCGTLHANAALSGRMINVRVESKGDHSPCVHSRWAWEPFSLVVNGIPAGSYTVKVRTVGHSGAVTAVVRID